MALPLPSHPLAVDSDVADYAVGLAYVVHLKNEAEALALLGIERDAWARAGAWTERLTDEVGRGQRALVTAFGVVFKETQERLRAASAPAPTATSEAPPTPELGLLAQLSNEAAARAAPRFEVAAPPPAYVAASPTPVPATVPGEDETTAVGEALRQPALPFEPSGPSALAAPGAVAPLAAADGASRVNLNSTLTAPAAVLRAPLPFVAASGKPGAPAGHAPEPHQLSLEQYASLCASLESFPEKAVLILQRYGITKPYELELVHKAWQARFASDASSRATWSAHVQQIRARLKGAK